MMPSEHLISKYVEDRDGLSEAELARLAATLRDDPELAVRLKEQLVVDELLGQHLSLDRRNFAAQVAQRIWDQETGMHGAIENTRDLLGRAKKRGDRLPRHVVLRQQQRRPVSRVRFLLAASLLIGVGVALWFLQSPLWQNVATVADADGMVTVERDGVQKRARAQLRVKPGDRLATGEDASVSFTYRDGTTLELDGGTAITLKTDQATRGKRVEVEYGNLVANIARQPRRKPMSFGTPAADAHVLGTELSLLVEDALTYLTVKTGRVKLERKDGSASVIVDAGQSGIATPDHLEAVPSEWPLERKGLVFLFETNRRPVLVREVTTSDLRSINLEPRGAAEFDRAGAMVLTGGAFVTKGVDDLLAPCRETSELTIEAILCAGRAVQSGRAPIVSFISATGVPDFVLFQAGENLIARLSTSNAGKSVSTPDIVLARLGDTEYHHLVVSYRPGNLVCYLDGHKAMERHDIQGGFRNWTSPRLVFGNESRSGVSWSGTLEGVAVYSRCLASHKARLNTLLSFERVAARGRDKP